MRKLNAHEIRPLTRIEQRADELAQRARRRFLDAAGAREGGDDDLADRLRKGAYFIDAKARSLRNRIRHLSK